MEKKCVKFIVNGILKQNLSYRKNINLLALIESLWAIYIIGFIKQSFDRIQKFLFKDF